MKRVSLTDDNARRIEQAKGALPAELTTRRARVNYLVRAALERIEAAQQGPVRDLPKGLPA